MNTQILELRRKRAATIQKAQHLLDIADQEERALTKEEAQDHDKLMAEIEELQNDIERRTRMAQLAGEGGAADDEGRQTRSQDPNLGMGSEELRNYSLLKAIRAAANNNWRGAELEQEASQATAERLGMEPEGFFVPWDWVENRRSVRLYDEKRGYFYAPVERRDLTVGTPDAGGNLVATDLLAGSFIDSLRNQMVLMSAGAVPLTGLVGDVSIPRKSGSATAYWLSESGAPTESEQGTDQVALTPHTVGAFTDFSRRLLKQSSVDVERFVRDDLAEVLALAIDYAGLHGNSGVDANQPDGVETFADTTSVVGGADGAAPTWGHVVGLETAVAVANAAIGRLSYITSAKVRGALKQTGKAGSTAKFIWSDDNMLNGYTPHVTNQVRDDRTKGSGTNLSTLFFGNWGDLFLGMWGGLDILVDPYTHSTSGTIRVVALQDVDWACRHDESFAAMLDADCN